MVAALLQTLLLPLVRPHPQPAPSLKTQERSSSSMLRTERVSRQYLPLFLCPLQRPSTLNSFLLRQGRGLSKTKQKTTTRKKHVLDPTLSILNFSPPFPREPIINQVAGCHSRVSGSHRSTLAGHLDWPFSLPWCSFLDQEALLYLGQASTSHFLPELLLSVS